MSLDSRINSIVQPLINDFGRSQTTQNYTQQTAMQVMGQVSALSNIASDTNPDATREQATVNMSGQQGSTSTQTATVGSNPVRVNDIVIVIGGRVFN